MTQDWPDDEALIEEFGAATRIRRAGQPRSAAR